MIDITGIIENRLEQCIEVARQGEWSPHKTAAVCKYLRKTLDGMTGPELAYLDGETLKAFVTNAATGWERYRLNMLS